MRLVGEVEWEWEQEIEESVEIFRFGLRAWVDGGTLS